MKRIVFTTHARHTCQIRGLSEKILISAVKKPDMIAPTKEGKMSYLKNLGKNYLKIIVSEEKNALVIITAYWIAKERAKR